MRILIETFVPAPPEATFEALLDPAVHAATSSGRERVVAVVRADPAPPREQGFAERAPQTPEERRLRLGNEVTFEATHLLVRQRLTARITLYDPPFAFEDTMVRGFFRSL